MNADTITSLIHKRADEELKRKLSESLDWIWQATGYSTNKPDESQEAEFLLSVRGGELGNALKQIPWIGDAMKVFNETAFAYMRDSNRNRAVSDFMSKVESLSAEMEAIRAEVEEPHA